MRQLQVIITRPQHAGGPTVAIINADVVDDWCSDWEFNESNSTDAGLLQSCLTLAVTAWALNSVKGRRAMTNSSFDFNIGDLASEIETMEGESCANDPSELLHYIQQQGIHSLSIETADAQEVHYWDYDDKLFDEDEVNESSMLQ